MKEKTDKLTNDEVKGATSCQANELDVGDLIELAFTLESLPVTKTNLLTIIEKKVYNTGAALRFAPEGGAPSQMFFFHLEDNVHKWKFLRY